MRRLAASAPREEKHFLIEGLATLAQADWVDAAELFRNATEQFPSNPQLWFNRALADENLGYFDKSIESYQRSLTLKPEQGEIFGNLSNIYRKQGKFPDAVQMACRAVAAGAPKSEALNMLALALAKQGNYGEAKKALDEAIIIAPDDGYLYANRANLAVDQLKFEEAWEDFSRAHSFDRAPIIHRDEGMARLLAGDYAAGLPLYEARLDVAGALRLHPTCPRWQGEDIRGKRLMIVAEQGYGDAIQFSRYALPLAQQGAELIWVVREPLRKLFAANLPGQIVVENEELPAADFWLPILSIPFAMGLKGPMAAPLFKAPEGPPLPVTLSGARKIGLVWKGSATHERDHERSVDLQLLAPLLNLPNAEFFAPFVGAAKELQQKNLPIVPLDAFIGDFADAAALTAQLDCLITVDTAAAHLAGALGVCTYLLLPLCPDWRWGVSGTTTSWYPSMTLLRQTTYGDWGSVIEKLVSLF